MAYTSIEDKISKSIAPVMRKLHDLNVKMLGMECSVLRITIGEPNSRGDAEETMTSVVIGNCIIKHPFGSNIELFEEYNQVTNEIDSTSVNFYELLPIELRISYDGDPDSENVNLKRGDMIVQVLKDEHDNKFPIIYQITKQFGKFRNRYNVTKNFEMTLYRPNLSPDMQYAIEQFVAQS